MPSPFRSIRATTMRKGSRVIHERRAHGRGGAPDRGWHDDGGWHDGPRDRLVERDPGLTSTMPTAFTWRRLPRVEAALADDGTIWYGGPGTGLSRSP